MNAHRANAVLKRDGTLTLEDLPFHAGDTVEIIVLETSVPRQKTGPTSLRGTVLHYDNPTDSVAESDWEATNKAL